MALRRTEKSTKWESRMTMKRLIHIVYQGVNTANGVITKLCSHINGNKVLCILGSHKKKRTLEKFFKRMMIAIGQNVKGVVL